MRIVQSVQNKWTHAFEAKLKNAFIQTIANERDADYSNWIFQKVDSVIQDHIKIAIKDFESDPKAISSGSANTIDHDFVIAATILQEYPEILSRTVESEIFGSQLMDLLIGALTDHWKEDLIDIGLEQGVFIWENGGINLTPHFKPDDAIEH